MLDAAVNDTVDRLSVIVTRIAASHDVPHAFATQDHLVDHGLTSMAMVDLMLAIEAAFDVTIPQTEMQPANFQSIASLARMMERMRG